ncbi:hypothetical protein H3C65_00100 [Patescibacteria group bacterium]|nr:hypothetical protein [Patescibacteria group bacterium]
MTVYAQELVEWGECVVDEIPTLKCFESIFSNILIMSSAFIVLVLFIMFVIGSFSYLTSLGNAEKIKKAQGTLRYALIGFILFISSFLILKIIDIIFLGGNDDIFKFTLEAKP